MRGVFYDWAPAIDRFRFSNGAWIVLGHCRDLVGGVAAWHWPCDGRSRRTATEAELFPPPPSPRGSPLLHVWCRDCRWFDWVFHVSRGHLLSGRAPRIPRSRRQAHSIFDRGIGAFRILPVRDHRRHSALDCHLETTCETTTQRRTRRWRQLRFAPCLTLIVRPRTKSRVPANEVQEVALPSRLRCFVPIRFHGLRLVSRFCARCEWAR
jgi:hypothetical protein